MTIRTKLIAVNIVVFGVILVAVAAIVYDRTREFEIAKLDARHDSYAMGVADEIEEQSWQESRSDVQDTTDIASVDISGLINVRVRLIDQAGRIVYERGALKKTLSAEMTGATGEKSVAREIIGIEGAQYRITAREIETDNNSHLTIILASSMVEIDERLMSLTISLIVTVAFALLFSAVAVNFVIGRSFQPLTEMIATVGKTSASSLHQRIELPSERNEVWRVANAFNEMMQRIENAFNSQRQFIADASHEMRTPLTVIFSELEYLRKHVDNESLQESIDIPLSEIDSLSHLVQQLLVLVRIDSQSMVLESNEVRLDELLADIVRMFGLRAMERRIHLNIFIEEAISIKGNAADLKRALINLVDNAVKYSFDGGFVEIRLCKTVGGSEVSICDNGSGFDELSVKHAFDRFYRSPSVRHSHEGNGLGLSIARELIEAQGGTIELSNGSSGGALIVVRFSNK